MAENTRETQLRGLATEWRTMTYNWRDCHQRVTFPA